jgi:hypothetical protein
MEQVHPACSGSRKQPTRIHVAVVALYRVMHSSQPAGTRQWIATTSHWEALLSVTKCALTTCTITLKLILRFARAQSVLRVCKHTSDSYKSKCKVLCAIDSHHKDLTNLQSQPTHFYEYVYPAATSSGPKLGHYQAIMVHVETEHHEAAADLLCHITVH